MASRAAMRKQKSRSFAGDALTLLVGPVTWAAHFTLIYGAHALLCGRGFSGNVAELVVGVTTVAAIGFLALVVLRQRRMSNSGDGQATQAFYRSVMILLVLLSMVAIGWAGVTVMFVQGCAALR